MKLTKPDRSIHLTLFVLGLKLKAYTQRAYIFDMIEVTEQTNLFDETPNML